MMKTKAKWADGLRFLCESGSGHAVAMDAPGDVGGADTAPSPMEMVLASLAACSGIDVINILGRMKVPPRSLEVLAEAERAAKPPRTFERIRLKYLVIGDVPEHKLARAIDLSARRYCSVGVMLGASAEIEHTFEIQSD